MPIGTSPGEVLVEEQEPVPKPTLASYTTAWLNYCLAYVPGLVLLVAIAFVARVLGMGKDGTHTVLFAVAIGVLFRNTLGLSPLLESGTRSYEIFWKVGIVVLGSQLGLQSFQRVGPRIVCLAVFEMVATIALTLWLTHRFGIRESLGSLLAAGMAICGVSAVIALASAVHNDDEDTSYAISVILLFGIVTLAVMPGLGLWLHLSDTQFGIWSGLVVNNTAEAVATGFMYSEMAGHYSTIAKLSRTIFLGVALLYFLYRKTAIRSAPRLAFKVRTIVANFPKFAIGLFLFSALTTMRFWSPVQLVALSNLSRWAFLVGFAGVGVRTDLVRLRWHGLKPLALACCIQSLIVAVMLPCVKSLF